MPDIQHENLYYIISFTTAIQHKTTNSFTFRRNEGRVYVYWHLVVSYYAASSVVNDGDPVIFCVGMRTVKI